MFETFVIMSLAWGSWGPYQIRETSVSTC